MWQNVNHKHDHTARTAQRRGSREANKCRAQTKKGLIPETEPDGNLDVT